ncbi:NACHT domain-containing protein [Actinomycetota bacterium Odt1-20B]
MVDAAALGARLASSTLTPLIKKLFVTDQPGAALVDKPVRISGLVSFRREKNSVTPKDVQKIADELVRRAFTSTPAHERPVDASEALSVRNALAHSLAGLGTLTIEDYEAVALGPEEFARTLRQQSGAFISASRLSESGELFYERLLHTAALHILNFFTQRSTYIARQQTRQTQQLGRLIKAVDVLLERLPSQSAEDAAFEARYAEHITQRHGTLTIYGLDIYAGTSEWPLDTAYLSLEAERGRFGDGGEDGAPVAAERILAMQEQVLLRGVAGSGKTTLIQWLAVKAADRTYEHGLTHLIGRVPFVLPMRRIVRPASELPIPGDFLRAVSCPIAGEQPPGWVERVLRARRGILLVDGIDEISEERRESARRWLRELAETFPGNLWLVASRPSAVPENWLDATGFAEVTLAPMTRDGIATFIRRWHRAAGADESVGAAMLRSVRISDELGRLATNPLMCGMLCALHHDRRGFLPQGRKRLYEAALTMLLERRDVEREVHRREAALPYATQIQLIQKLAWWLIRNSRAELDRSEALHIIGQATPSMGLGGTPEDVYDALMLRSGLLREPAEGRVDFLHRTFQDYLGARLAVQELDFDLLLNNADKPEWEDVILLAVAHGRPREAEFMLRRLVETGTFRGKLLAAAGLPYAAEVAPDVRALVEEGVGSLIPPRSLMEADQLAEAGGDLILGLLPGPEDIDSGTTAYRVVEAAARLATESALDFLVAFRGHPGAKVQRTLAGAWGRFDRERYAQDILAHLPRQHPVIVHGREDLETLRAIGGWRNIRVKGAYRVEDLTELIVADLLTHLRVEAPDPVEKLAWLTAFPNLQEIYVEVDLSPSWVAADARVPAGITVITLPAQGS